MVLSERESYHFVMKRSSRNVLHAGVECRGAKKTGVRRWSLPMAAPSPGETMVKGASRLTYPFFSSSNGCRSHPRYGGNMSSRQLLPSTFLLLFRLLFVITK